MISNLTIKDEIEFTEFAKVSLNKFYKELNKAIESKRDQSVYRLSKIITRYSIR